MSMLRIQLQVFAMIVLGIIAGTAWTLSGLAVNLVHLVIGSLVIGVVLGQIIPAVFMWQQRRRYIYTAFSVCSGCGKDVLCRYPLQGVPICTECANASDTNA